MIITIANQKGGTGKTSLSVALCAGMTRRGLKTLLVDMDSQSDATFTARVEGNGAYEMLVGEKTAEDAIVHSDTMGDVIPSTIMLDNLSIALNKYRAGKEYRLKKCLDTIKDDYNYVIIDTPRSLGIELTNALAASDSVIIPISADGYSVSGMADLVNTINSVKEYMNPSLKIEGVLLSRIDSREKTERMLRERVEDIARDALGAPLFDFSIRSAAAVAQASLDKANIYEKSPMAPVIEDYEHLIDILENGGKNE